MGRLVFTGGEAEDDIDGKVIGEDGATAWVDLAHDEWVSGVA